MRIRGAAAWIGLVVLGTNLYAQDALHFDPEEAARWSMACRSAARQLAEEVAHLENLTPSQAAAAVDALETDIRADQEAHQKRSRSQELCAASLRTFHRELITKAVHRAVERANVQTKRPVLETDLIPLAATNWTSMTARVEHDFLRAHLDPLFTQARERAVALCKHETDTLITYPAFADLDQKLVQLARQNQREDGHLLPEDFDQLTPWLRPYAGQVKGAQLEEIRAYVSDTAARLRDEIRTTYEQEARKISDMTQADRIPENLLTATNIYDWVLSQWKDQPSNPSSYGLFQVLQWQLSQLASKAEQERLRQFLDTLPPLTTSEDLMARMRETPALHVQAEASARELEDQFSRDWAPDAITKYVQPLSEKDRTQAGAQLLRSPVLSEHIRKSVQALLPDARNRLKDRQVKALFPNVFPLGPLSDESISLIRDAYQNHSVTQLEKTFPILSIEHPKWNDPPENTPLLDETTAYVLLEVNTRIQQAIDVLDRQLHLLRRLETDEKQQLIQEVADDTPVETIRANWRRLLEQRWTQAPADPDFPRLLGRTLEELNKTVRQLYDSQRRESAERPASSPPAAAANIEVKEAHREETPSEPAPEPPPEETPEEQPALEKTEQMVRLAATKQAQGILLLTDTETDQCRIQVLGLDGSAQGELFIPVLGRDSWDLQEGALAQSITPMLESQLETWKSAKSGFLGLGAKPVPRLLIYIHADSREVRYRAILQLRREMERQVTQWLQQKAPDLPPAEIVWIAGTE